MIISGEIWVAFLVEGMVQLFLAWSNVFNTLAVAQLEPRIIVAYRYAMGSATLVFFVIVSFLAPIIASYYSLSFTPILDCLLSREQYWPKLTRKEVLLLTGAGFLCALLGSVVPQNLYLASLAYLEPKFASAMSNCSPLIVSSITLPVFFRKEISALRERRVPEKLKLLGVIVVGFFMWAGAVCLDFLYEGPVLLRSRVSEFAPPPPTYTERTSGVLMSIASSVLTALSLIIQGKMNEKFSCYFLNMVVVNVMGAIQATTFALCIGKGSWKLGNMNLFAVTYLGVVCSGIMMGLTAFCMRRISQEIVSGFNPVMLIISTGPHIMSNGKLRIGSVLSGLVMIFGWSATIWAKFKAQASPPPESADNSSPNDMVDVELGSTPNKK